MSGIDRRPFPPLLKYGVFVPEIEAQIREVFTLVEQEALEADPSLADQIQGIVTRSNYRIPPELIDRLPRLRIISTNGVGYDGIPVAYAREKGIVVTNTPEVLNQAVAELAVGLLLAVLRQLPASDQFVRQGAWLSQAPSLGVSLAGKRVGIVGLGRIGKEIAKRLIPFDVELSYYGRRPQDVPWPYFESVTALAEQADVLVVACPGGAETHHLINETVLAALGPNGFLVNISRGSVVDEAALCRALEGGVIRAAGLDVFEEEPLGDSPLRRMDNVVLTPHIGSATQETRRRMVELVIRNLTSFFSTGQAVSPVT